jgi:putative phage-type endonuclease
MIAATIEPIDRAEWLARRRGFLGASEVAAVCGLDPFRTPLDVWASKKGLVESASSEAAEIGNLLERPLLQHYANRSGVQLRLPGTMQRADHPWMAATPDALADWGSWRDVQVKVVGSRMAYAWECGAPEYVQVQVQWELHVTELLSADVVALVGGTDFRVLQLQRDDDVISHLVEICSRFWRDHIEGGAMPDVDGTERARAILAARFPRPTAGMGAAGPDFIERALRYREINKAVAAAQEEREMLANAMRLAIGESTGLQWDGGYVSWKPNKSGERRLYVHAKE